MSKRKRNDDASTATKEVKYEALDLIDMNGIQSRHTGLSVDYDNACTRRGNHQCHIWNNRATWNGFFVNVGLVLQESESGDMSLAAVSESVKIACRATPTEKAQAATLLYWLLTKHKCVKEASISEDIFAGNEGVVCRALSDSVGVTAVTLMLSSVLTNDNLVSSLCSMMYLTRLSVVTDTREAFFPKLGHLLWMSPSATDVLRTALSPMRCSRECASRFEGLCLRKSMCYVSILARTDQGPRNLWSHLGCAFFAWGPMQLLTTLQVASPERGPDLDVRVVCEAVSLSSVMTHFDLELRILKSEYAALIQKMLRSTKTLKFFGLTYNGVERHYRDPFHQFNVDSLVPLYNCARCLTTHILETPRVKPWIRALLQARSPVKELRFSLFAFCTLECRAFLNALSKNTSLSMLTIPRLGQVPSEYGKFAASARVMDRVTAEIDCIVVYPDAFALPQHVPIGSVTCAVLGRTLSDAAEFGLVAHVCLIVHSVLCSTNETEPSTTPLVQLIRNAPPALASVNIRIESVCCSECWNRLAPPLCDAVHHNTNIRSLLIKLPMNSAMRLLPLAGLLHRNPGLFNFMLDTPCPEVFEEFLREASEPKLWNNYNLEFVEFGCDAPDLVGMVVTMKQVTDRNTTLATRAARFLQGKHNIDNARALETMNGSSLFVKRVCGLLRVDKVQALDKITACLIDVADMKKFLRLAGVVHRDLVCGETADGRTQLADLNEDCLRYLRRYLKFSDIRHSPV